MNFNAILKDWRVYVFPAAAALLGSLSDGFADGTFAEGEALNAVKVGLAVLFGLLARQAGWPREDSGPKSD